MSCCHFVFLSSNVSSGFPTLSSLLKSSHPLNLLPSVSRYNATKWYKVAHSLIMKWKKNYAWLSNLFLHILKVSLAIEPPVVCLAPILLEIWMLKLHANYYFQILATDSLSYLHLGFDWVIITHKSTFSFLTRALQPAAPEPPLWLLLTFLPRIQKIWSMFKNASIIKIWQLLRLQLKQLKTATATH